MSRRFLLTPDTSVVVAPPSGGTNDAPLFQAAIDSLSDTGGVVVFSGDYTISSTITVLPGVWLVGMGWKASRIFLADGANCDMIRTVPRPLQSPYTGLSGFYMDGNRGNNTTGHAIVLNSDPTDQTVATCSVNVIDTVYVEYAPQNAFQLVGGNMVETRVLNCFAYSSGNRGFNGEGSDFWIDNCTAGESLGNGFTMYGQGIRMSNCKSYWSGRPKAVRSNTIPGYGDGFQAGYDLTVENAQITNCEAQDSSGPGLRISGIGGRIQMHIDSNNGIGLGGQSYMLDIGQSTRMHLDVNFGTGTGRFPSQYFVNLSSTNLSGNLIDLWNGGAPGQGLYRPTSLALPAGNTMNARGVYS